MEGYLLTAHLSSLASLTMTKAGAKAEQVMVYSGRKERLTSHPGNSG